MVAVSPPTAGVPLFTLESQRMKAVLIRLFLLPGGVTLLLILSIGGLILAHWPEPSAQPHAQGNREEFPGQRRGGGTHWDSRPHSMA